MTAVPEDDVTSSSTLGHTSSSLHLTEDQQRDIVLTSDDVIHAAGTCEVLHGASHGRHNLRHGSTCSMSSTRMANILSGSPCVSMTSRYHHGAHNTSDMVICPQHTFLGLLIFCPNSVPIIASRFDMIALVVDSDWHVS